MRSQDEFAKTAIELRCAFRNSLDMEIEDIRRGLGKPGKTQRGLAKALNVDDSAITRLLKGEREIKVREIPLIRAYLDAESGVSSITDDGSGRITANRINEPLALHEFGTFPKDVPIMGVTVGGTEGDFILNMGETVDYARRTPAIARSPKVFALYVQGSSMSRWRDQGTLVYCDPVRPPRPGDRVVVELHPEKEGEGHPAFLKELVTKTGTKLRLKQYNPEGVIEINLTKVFRMHRVIEWEELLSV